MITEEIVHIKGYPKKLIVFLHGYIDSPDYIDKNVTVLLDNLDDVAIHIPQSPHVCEIYPKKFQWYSMHRFDPNDDRKFIDDWNEYLGIYDRMKPGIIEAFDLINPYIDNCLSEYDIASKDLYICGYSQGGTLAVFTSLMRDEEVGGLISFGGIFAPREYIKNNYKSVPDSLLIHGEVDNQVRFEALEYTKENLEEIGCQVAAHAIHNGQHRLTEEGMELALRFIQRKSAKKIAV
ncbi:MAG: dienelactone hydrolase family protein [Lactobacillaceae bacterium]|jgi:phospholipase/carboxylesterase|nr:dienelactone hydrolase family protein [Lactobacillaceae bacterium]